MSFLTELSVISRYVRGNRRRANCIQRRKRKVNSPEPKDSIQFRPTVWNLKSGRCVEEVLLQVAGNRDLTRSLILDLSDAKLRGILNEAERMEIETMLDLPPNAKWIIPALPTDFNKLQEFAQKQLCLNSDFRTWLGAVALNL